MDERGYIDITDRKKDMFIRGGFNAYPAEIENLLLAHPDIAQVAVIGVPDERMGEVGMAFVVPTTGTPPEPRPSIVAWAREQMANFKAPRYVEIVDALPLNASNKVLKSELRDRAERAWGTSSVPAWARPQPRVKMVSMAGGSCSNGANLAARSGASGWCGGRGPGPSWG